MKAPLLQLYLRAYTANDLLVRVFISMLMLHVESCGVQCKQIVALHALMARVCVCRESFTLPSLVN